jgi:hypothetical protein
VEGLRGKEKMATWCDFIDFSQLCFLGLPRRKCDSPDCERYWTGDVGM